MAETANNFPNGFPENANTSLMFLNPIPKYVLTVNGQSGPLATIHANGHVTLHDEDRVNEAAKVFWQAIHFHRPRCPNCNSDLQLV